VAGIWVVFYGGSLLIKHLHSPISFFVIGWPMYSFSVGHANNFDIKHVSVEPKLGELSPFYCHSIHSGAH
jgi:hypothetical protein